MRTPKQVIYYYTQIRKKSLKYVRKIAQARDDRKLLAAVKIAQAAKEAA